MNVMRYTVIDDHGAVSFVAPCEASPALVAACARNPGTLEELLDRVEEYYRPLRRDVLNGLAVFDERNSDGKYDAVHAALQFCAPQDLPVFRVVDEPTRDASGQPVRAGAMIFNLRAKRIIQIQNYQDVERKGRVRVLENDRRGPLLPYELPSEWSIVP